VYCWASSCLGTKHNVNVLVAEQCSWQITAGLTVCRPLSLNWF